MFLLYLSLDDDEQNDYGFNKRPSVRGIKPRFGSTNEILQQMQDQLSQPTVNNNLFISFFIQLETLYFLSCTP
jgi:hypothetical protein